ncbi:hypothetical protein ACWCPF_37130 [Streptomyces sp. NPDC001858]
MAPRKLDDPDLPEYGNLAGLSSLADHLIRPLGSNERTRLHAAYTNATWREGEGRP